MTLRLLPLDRWTLRVHEPGPDVPAHVAEARLDVRAPVSVHTALVGAGLVPDPRFDQHEDELHWIGAATWRMQTQLAPEPADLDDPTRRFSLDFGGLDTIATVTLGGHEVLRSTSMHVAHRVDVTDRMRAGERELVVRFEPVVDWAEAQRSRLGDRPFVEWDEGALPFHFARKMACNFGWDWGPTVVTAGIWRPAALVAWSHARIRHCRPLVRELEAARSAIPSTSEVRAAGVGSADERVVGVGSADERVVGVGSADERVAGAGSADERVARVGPSSEPVAGVASEDVRASEGVPADRLTVAVFVDLECALDGGEDDESTAATGRSRPRRASGAVPNSHQARGSDDARLPTPGTPRDAWLSVRLCDPAGAEVVALEHPADGTPVCFDVSDPQRWWPHTHGDQPLYTLEVALHAGGRILDRVTRRVGLRTVHLDTTPEGDDGARFVLEINGEPVFCKGANWIPDDCFVDVLHGDRDRIRRRLELAVDGHHNMLRVWGGGIYELPEFYDACDELGILVWQDFLFACAMYPEEPPYAALVEAEAREAVAARAHHASLVIWNGCNENFWAHRDWGWPPWHVQLDGATWGEGFYLDLLPRVCAELDPSRPYWPGSPWSAVDRDPQHDDFGTRHVWDVWNETRPEVYRDYRPRFVAEFGFQGPATRSTWREALGDPLPDPSSDRLHRHQKAIEGRKKLASRLAERHAPVDPATEHAIEHWLHATQANQARAVEMGVTAWRAQWPRCTGALYWQLNDCWPSISWASLDWRCRRKPLWYALRRAFAPRLVSLERALDGVGLDLVLVNDTDDEWSPRVHVRQLLHPAGEVHVALDDLVSATVARRAVHRRPLPPSVGVSHDVAATFVCADVVGPSEASLDPRGDRGTTSTPDDAMRATWWWSAPVEMAANPAPGTGYQASIVGRGPHEAVLEIQASAVLRNVVIAADRELDDVEVDRNVLTLLPGEQVSIVMRGPVVPSDVSQVWIGT